MCYINSIFGIHHHFSQLQSYQFSSYVDQINVNTSQDYCNNNETVPYITCYKSIA